MNAKDFLRLGVPLGEATRRATDFVAKFVLEGGEKSRLREGVASIVANPAAFADHPLRKEFAKAIASAPRRRVRSRSNIANGAKAWRHEAVMQMEMARLCAGLGGRCVNA
jgi:hypothetical protein